MNQAEHHPLSLPEILSHGDQLCANKKVRSRLRFFLQLWSHRLSRVSALRAKAKTPRGREDLGCQPNDRVLARRPYSWNNRPERVRRRNQRTDGRLSVPANARASRRSERPHETQRSRKLPRACSRSDSGRPRGSLSHYRATSGPVSSRFWSWASRAPFDACPVPCRRRRSGSSGACVGPRP